MNIAQQDRIAQGTKICPRCGALPGKSCWEKARGNPYRHTFMARPHAEQVEDEQEGLRALPAFRPVVTHAPHGPNDVLGLVAASSVCNRFQSLRARAG